MLSSRPFKKKIQYFFIISKYEKRKCEFSFRNFRKTEIRHRTGILSLIRNIFFISAPDFFYTLLVKIRPV